MVGIRVSIDGTGQMATTDSDGYYEIVNVAPGVKDITFSKNWIEKETHTVFLIDRTEELATNFTTLDVSMRAEPPTEPINDLWVFYSLGFFGLILSAFPFAGAILSRKGHFYSVMVVSSLVGLGFTIPVGRVLGLFHPGLICLAMLAPMVLVLVFIQARFFSDVLPDSLLPLSEDDNGDTDGNDDQ